MNIIPINQISRLDFTATPTSILRQYWKNQKSFSCIGTPKQYNHFLLLDECSAEYTLKNGQTLFAKPFDLVYTPAGSEYKLRLFDFKSEKSNTLGINFTLHNKDNTPFIFSDTPDIFPGTEFLAQLLKIEQYGTTLPPCPGRTKAGLYNLLCSLSESCQSNTHSRFSMIAEGIRYLENDIALQLTVPELARMCNVSERYFRKLFSEYAGIPVSQFRLQARINRAKNYLASQSMTISEISDLLGFTDSAYFAKEFKKATGKTPSAYKNSKNNL